VLRCEQRPSPAAVAEALDREVGTPVHHVVRLRTADGNPMSVEESWVDTSRDELEFIDPDDFGQITFDTELILGALLAAGQSASGVKRLSALIA
jgi:DNA-binding GntR family transcriptional regulator